MDLASQCFLLPSKRRRPFHGHLQMRFGGEGAQAHLALRICAGESAEISWSSALAIYDVLQGLEDKDALSLARKCWDALLVLPRSALGPAAGEDLSLLLFVEDTTQSCISGVGLDSVWSDREGETQQLSGPGHPELSRPGLPQVPPRALTLSRESATWFGLCAGEPPPKPEREKLRILAGAGQ